MSTSRIVLPPTPVTLPRSANPTISFCLGEARSAPVKAKTQSPNQSRIYAMEPNITYQQQQKLLMSGLPSPVPHSRGMVPKRTSNRRLQMTAIGYVHKENDGRYKGHLRTVSI